MIRSHLRLPEIRDPGTRGRWLVRHVMGLTFGSLLVLTILAAVALSTVQVDLTVEAAGTVRRTPSGRVEVVLQVPSSSVPLVMEGQAVRIRIPEGGGAGGEAASLVLEGRVVSVGVAPGGGGAPVLVVVEVEGAHGHFQAGTIVEGRIIAGRQRASDRLLSSLTRRNRG